MVRVRIGTQYSSYKLWISLDTLDWIVSSSKFLPWFFGEWPWAAWSRQKGRVRVYLPIYSKGPHRRRSRCGGGCSGKSRSVVIVGSCRCSGAIGADESFPDAEDGAEDSCCVIGLTPHLFLLPWFAPMTRYDFRSGQLAQRKPANGVDNCGCQNCVQGWPLTLELAPVVLTVSPRPLGWGRAWAAPTSP